MYICDWEPDWCSADLRKPGFVSSPYMFQVSSWKDFLGVQGQSKCPDGRQNWLFSLSSSLSLSEKWQWDAADKGQAMTVWFLAENLQKQCVLVWRWRFSADFRWNVWCNNHLNTDAQMCLCDVVLQDDVALKDALVVFGVLASTSCTHVILHSCAVFLLLDGFHQVTTNVWNWVFHQPANTSTCFHALTGCYVPR